MPNSRTTTAEPTAADEPELSIQEQVDLLLKQIETEEPGTIDKALLPADFVSPKVNKPSPAPAITPAAAAPAPPIEPAPAEPEPAPAAADDSQAEMLAALNSALQGMGGDSAPAVPEPAPVDDSQAQMLAAINGALQDMGGGSAPAPKAAQTPAAEAGGEITTQDEINALLNAVPDATPTPQPPAEPALSTEDQIAQEIEGLLSAHQEETAAAPAPDQATAEAATPAATAAPASEPTIDDLDKMLANEIDDDEELAGDFHSVDDVTKGIDATAEQAPALHNEHAATASDVAAELDSQPESNPADEFADEDPLAALDAIAKTIETNEKAYQAEVRDHKLGIDMPAWLNRLRQAKEWLLQGCFLLNWPARRFLSIEWRANLGYIALMNLFFGVAVWLYIIFL